MTGQHARPRVDPITFSPMGFVGKAALMWLVPSAAIVTSVVQAEQTSAAVPISAADRPPVEPDPIDT